MIEILGANNTAMIFTDVLDEKAAEQIKLLCDQEFVRDSKIRIMPDVHAGAGCTIGTTMTITDKVVPNLVGVDIGCGMETVRIAQTRLELQKLDKLIYEKIPSGRNVRVKTHRFCEEIDLSKLRCVSQANADRAYLSIGTLGGVIFTLYILLVYYDTRMS
jgi:tRNA-splicing ligase RtcB (3'-phosphate/5'-hydroxy nucleic acid ligase)